MARYGRLADGTSRDCRAARSILTAPTYTWTGTNTSPGNLWLVRMATYTFSVATRRMEPYDERDDLGLREISLAMYRVDLDPS